MKVSRVERVEDVEQSARFMTMTVATHALKNLTVFPFARRALMDLAGDKPLMSLLRMEFNAEGQQHAASVLGNMCLNADCCQRLVYDGLIETLIELLKLSTVAGVHQEAAYALANICSISEEYEKFVVCLSLCVWPCCTSGRRPPCAATAHASPACCRLPCAHGLRGENSFRI